MKNDTAGSAGTGANPGTGTGARLGRATRTRRTALGLTLDAVAARTGLSKSFLSQVESGQANPTLSTLERLASALDTGLAALLGAPAQTPPSGPAQPVTTTRRPARPVRHWAPGEGRTYPLTGPDGQGFEAVLADGDPVHHADPITHPGAELCFVVEGTVRIDLDGQEHELHAGETLHYDSGLPHRIVTGPATRFLLVVATRPDDSLAAG